MILDIQEHRCARGLWPRSNGFSGQIKRAYVENKAFDVHPTSKHKRRDSKTDQLTGIGSVWKQDSFSGKTGNTTIPKYNFQGQREGSITKSLRDVCQKGTEKAEQKFNHKMYERFEEILLSQD